MKTYEVTMVKLHVCLSLALDGGEWSASGPDRFIPRETARSTQRLMGAAQNWFGRCGEETDLLSVLEIEARSSHYSSHYND
jgi:hypothetical protein